MSAEPPESLRSFLERFDPSSFDAPGGRARIRCTERGVGSWDFVFERGTARLAQPLANRRPDAALETDSATWSSLAMEDGAGLAALRAQKLVIRHNVQLVIGLLIATGGSHDQRQLRFAQVPTRLGMISTFQAGAGDEVVLLHGLGASKASLLPLVPRLAGSHRVIGMDLPGFGDSAKPLGAAYDASFFARSVTGLLDALGLERAHFVGHSLGGRIALEVGLASPERVGKLVLLTPSLAWLRERRWAWYVRLLRPELALLNVVPHEWTEAVMRRTLSGSSPWSSMALDEFLRVYRMPRGRAAFYAAARQIYLEEPGGPAGFWARLAGLEPAALFVWGRRDRLVPAAFRPHVWRALPSSRHVTLDTGHVPQLEQPAQLAGTILGFLRGDPEPATGRSSRSA